MSAINTIIDNLKDQIAITPGGTSVGNGIRSIASSLSGGLLGNGIMKQGEGETKKDFLSRMFAVFGAGVDAANSTNSTIENGVKAGVVMQRAKGILLTLCGLVGGFFLVRWAWRKVRGKKRRKY